MRTLNTRVVWNRIAVAMAATVLVSGVGGCSSSKPEPAASSTQPAASSMSGIRLSGDFAGTTLLVDEVWSFRITAPNANPKFNVEPGSHRIRVEKNGAMVVDKTVTIPRGEIVEIAVP